MDTDDHDALRLMLVIAAAHRARRLLAPHRSRWRRRHQHRARTSHYQRRQAKYNEVLLEY